MDKSTSKENVSKIYCEKCDEIFNSKQKFDVHNSKHSSGLSCEACPIDTVLDKIIGLFKKAK